MRAARTFVSALAVPAVTATIFAASALLAGCHNSTDGDVNSPSSPSAESSGEGVGSSIRDAGGRAVDGIKSGAKATGDWAVGVKNGIKGPSNDPDGGS